MTPTVETYTELQTAYDAFNGGLFDGKLPECLITLQREKNSCGYFSADRFANRRGDKTHEIAMNPTYFGVVPVVEVMQTLAHEMSHVWQHHFGTPGRGRYHNEEWAQKMESIGLMPSDTGKPGGRRTGDRMADYPIPGGLFLQVCDTLLTQEFTISWYDRFAPPAAVDQSLQALGLSGGPITAEVLAQAFGSSGVHVVVPAAKPANKSNRVKYTCGCGSNVWGKPGLRITCVDCGEAFDADGPEPACIDAAKRASGMKLAGLD